MVLYFQGSHTADTTLRSARPPTLDSLPSARAGRYNMMAAAVVVILLRLAVSALPVTSVTGPPTVLLRLDLTQPPEQQRLEKFWQASVGSGHAVLGLQSSWQRQLKAVHNDTGIRGVRFHGSFDDDMGPVVTVEATTGRPSYNFTLLDALYDGILAAGVHPIVELSFMPQAIAKCTPGPTCGGNESGMATWGGYRCIEALPTRWALWGDLVGAFVSHMAQRHGIDELLLWRFEVWKCDTSPPPPPPGCWLYVCPR